MADIEEVWYQQARYNSYMKLLQTKTSSEWMINYILGAHSELSQLLDQTQWKQHRTVSVREFGPNIEEELADITKYIFSMWQLMGYEPEEMLKAVFEKGEILDQLAKQETGRKLIGQSILMLDLDGVVADFRQGFMSWLELTGRSRDLKIKPEQIGLHLDLNNGWDYASYETAKIQFEQEGGYNTLPPMQENITAINMLKELGWYVIVYTARPYTVYKRIWKDTWTWMRQHNLRIDELHFGHADRVMAAQKLSLENLVVAMEDDPSLIERYLASSIPVFVVQQPYNINMKYNKRMMLLAEKEAGPIVASFVHQFSIA